MAEEIYAVSPTGMPEDLFGTSLILPYTIDPHFHSFSKGLLPAG